MIAQAIYLILTFIIPLRQTYNSLKNPEKNENQIWAVYWAIYTLVNFLVWLLPLLQYQPFQLLILLTLVWLYHDQYRGAIIVDSILRQSLQKNALIKGCLSLVTQKTKILNYFQDKQTGKQKTKDQ